VPTVPAGSEDRLTFVSWCFHCYALNDHPTGPRDVCGQPVEAPDGRTYVGGLMWVHHPDGDRAVLAAQTLHRQAGAAGGVADRARDRTRAPASTELRGVLLRDLDVHHSRGSTAEP